MNNLQNHIKNYLEYCKMQKRLDEKTLKAYRIDLQQFSEQIYITETANFTSTVLEKYIINLHQKYAPKTVKRKIASLKAFFRYLEPVILPKTIPLHTIEILLNTAYEQYCNATNDCKKKTVLRDIAVIELLFATGIRISELCTIQYQNIDLQNNIIIIKIFFMAICFYLNFKNLLIGKGKIQNLIGFAPKYRMEYSYNSLRK